MSYKDIIVQIDTPAATARYEMAAEIAARASGHLTGVFLKTSLINQYTNIETIAFLPPNDLSELIRVHNEGQDEAATAAGAALAKVAASAGAGWDTRVIIGDTPEDLTAQARCADLVILPPPTAAPAHNVHASAIDIALASGGPVLIAPAKIEAIRIGRRVLIAWNASREAARAVRDALPLLAADATLEVRMARPKDGAGDGADALQRRLERHGFKVNVVVAVEEGQSVPDWLRAEAARADCDLVVMGLYGHTRLREFVLGGVSREMIHAPSLPTLLSH